MECACVAGGGFKEELEVIKEAMAISARNMDETRPYNQLDVFRVRTSCDVWDQHV